VRKLLLSILLSLLCVSLAIAITPIKLQPWQVIPPTPNLPAPNYSGYAPINHVKIWYAEYGQGSPVILLHGGLVNSNYWGKLIPALKKHYHIIVMDSRGHGRSTLNNESLSYHLMAKDVLALMDFLHLQKAAIVGSSDGANIGLDIAIHHPERLTKLFACGGNSNPEAIMDVSQYPSFSAFTKRIKNEYMILSPTPSIASYNLLSQRILKMWESEPNFTAQMLGRIAVPVWIVAGEYDEAVKRSNTEYMAKTIHHARLLIEPNVGHFAFLQDPEKFNEDVLHFLKLNANQRSEYAI
jgi:pimeloyl-ACP methyl ester carboxylesterase